MRNATRAGGLLLAALLLLPLTARAQTDLTPQWTVTAGSNSYLLATGDALRGGAYSPTTGNVYVATRAGGAKVVILSGATGDSTGVLNMTGIDGAGSIFPISKVGTDASGRIYALNLVTTSGTGTQVGAKIYRWETEASAPSLIVSDTLRAGARYGDGFTVEGGGAGETVRFYIGGSLNNSLFRLTYNTAAATYTKSEYQFATARGRGGAAELSTGNFVTNGSGNTIALVQPKPGQTPNFEILAQIDGTFIGTGNDVIAAMEKDGMLFLAIGPTGSDATAQTFSVIRSNLDLSSPEIVSRTPAALGSNRNGNVAGFADFDEAAQRLIVGSTNNFIGSFFLNTPVATNYSTVLDGFNSVNAEYTAATGSARLSLLSGVLTVEGMFTNLSSTLRPVGAAGPLHIHLGMTGVNGPVIVPLAVTADADNRGGTFVGDYTLANFATAERSEADIVTALNAGNLYINLHTEDQPSGEIRGQIYPTGNMGPAGPMLVAPADAAQITLEGDASAPVTPTWRKVMDPEGNPVIYGWQLSTVATFDAEETTEFFSTGTDTSLVISVGSLYQAVVELGGGTQALFHRAFATDGSVGDYGPSRSVEFTLGTLTTGPAIWQVNAADGTFFRPDNNTRGGAYNPTTGNVIVVSRSGGLRPVILDAATGDSVGVLSTAGIAGGTFTLSEIGVTSDGQIFGANLTVNPADSPVRVYYWEDEFSQPRLVYNGSGVNALEGPRYGDAIGVGGSGDEVVVYLSGSGAQDRVAVLKSNANGMLALDDYLTPEAGQARARYGIAPVPGQDSIWVNSPTHLLAKVSTTTGEIGREGDENVVFETYGDISFANGGDDGDRSYILTGPQFGVAERFALVDVTGEPFILAVTPAVGTAGNGNATGFTAFDVRNGNLIGAASNNGIAAFPSPVNVIDEDIASDAIPVAGEITSPANGSSVTVEGNDMTMFTTEWNAGSDDDGDNLEYRWQFGTSPNFSGAILIDAEVGSATTYSTSFGVLNNILAGAGVATDSTVTVYVRIVTSDGDNYDASAPVGVTLTRGVVTAAPGELLPTEFALIGTSPNPARDMATLRIDLPQTAEVTVEVYDVMGRRVQTSPMTTLGSGANRTLSLGTSALASGTYLYRVQARMSDATEVRTGQLIIAR